MSDFYIFVCYNPFRMLEHEVTVSRTNENTAVLRKVQESGVKLFYYLVEFYTEEATLCPPTKQLFTTCLEKLGQVYYLSTYLFITTSKDRL